MRVLPDAVGPRVAEAAGQDARQLQAQLFGERADLVLALVDQIAARFRVLAVGEPVANRPHAAAETAARVDDGDVGAVEHEIVRGGESGQAGAGHEHADAAQRAVRLALLALAQSPIHQSQLSHLFQLVALGLEHGDQAVGSDEVRGADDDEGAAGAGEQRFELRQPVAVALDQQPLDRSPVPSSRPPARSARRSARRRSSRPWPAS